jgi:hypothetical protein
MPITLRAPRIVAAAALLVPCLAVSVGHAQAWRSSILALPSAAVIAADSTASASTPAPALVPATRIAPPLRGQPSIVGPIAGGLLFAAAGAAGGALLGAAADQGSRAFIPAGAAFGFLFGEAVVLPVGVHLGNGRRGLFLPDLGASVVGGVAALGLGAVTQSGVGYLVGVGGQLAMTVATERSASRRRQREAAEEAKRAQDRGVSMPAPPAEPDPLVPPPPPTK